MGVKNYNTGIAAEYYVLSMLFRKGYEAYLTLGNKKSVDIRVIGASNTITIDVKAVQGYSSLIVNNVTSIPNHYIIFLIYNNKFDDVSYIPEVYIVPSQDIQSLSKMFGDQARIFKGAIESFKDKWSLIHDVLA